MIFKNTRKNTFIVKVPNLAEIVFSFLEAKILLFEFKD